MVVVSRLKGGASSWSLRRYQGLMACAADQKMESNEVVARENLPTTQLRADIIQAYLVMFPSESKRGPLYLLFSSSRASGEDQLFRGILEMHFEKSFFFTRPSYTYPKPWFQPKHGWRLRRERKWRGPEPHGVEKNVERSTKSKGPICYKCNEVGHISSFCPRRKFTRLVCGRGSVRGQDGGGRCGE